MCIFVPILSDNLLRLDYIQNLQSSLGWHVDSCWPRRCNKPVSDESFFYSSASSQDLLQSHGHRHTHITHSWVTSDAAVYLHGSTLEILGSMSVGDSCLLSHVCVCVCVFFPGALPSLVLFLVWCFWWGPWQPYSCACACAWRTGVVHGLACSAPPITSALWPRAIQVGQYTQPHNLMCPIPCLCYIYFKIHEVNWILTAYKGQEN